MNEKDLNTVLKKHAEIAAMANLEAAPIFYQILEASIKGDTDELQKINDLIDKAIEKNGYSTPTIQTYRTALPALIKFSKEKD